MGISLEYIIGFSDSELISYHSEGEIFEIVLRSWNDKRLEISLKDVIMVVDRGAGDFSNILISDNGPVLTDALQRSYEKIPSEHPYKLFQFVDNDDEIVFEIVASNYSISHRNF